MPASIRIDRVFQAGRNRWVIDHKSGSEAEGEVEAFIHRQQQRYRAQLEEYSRSVAASPGVPVRSMLYFPMLARWVR